MKYCKDCKWCYIHIFNRLFTGFEYAKCTYFGDRVSKNTRSHYCSLMRECNEFCGKNAKYFEDKNETKKN